MPRRRTIQCDNCGHYVLKRDDVCEQCGEDTPQAKRRMKFQLVYFGVMAIMLFAGWSYLKHAMQAIGH